MKNISSNGLRGQNPLRIEDSDTSAIHALDRKDASNTVLGAALSNTEHMLSVPKVGPPSRQFTELTNLLGKSVTIGNVAWTPAALPHMRALQKTLVEHSLKLDKEDRGDLLSAILVVEDAVKLRLRFQQMEDFEAEMGMTTDESEKKQ